MNVTRAPPPRGAPPAYAFVSRVYPRNLRPIVIAVGLFSAFWMLASAISNFRNQTVDRSEHAPNLAIISLAIGAVYSAVAVIEIFGVFAATKQRVALIRLYAFLSVLVALIVIGAALLRTVIHFVLKHEIINECVNISTGQTAVFSFGVWGPTTDQQLSPDEASDWCNNGWSHESFSEIVSLIFTIILSASSCILSFAYYRQVLDPSSPANASRVPAGRNTYPTHYAPAYGFGSSVGNLSYTPKEQQREEEEDGYDEQFAPPYEAGKLPGYGVGDGKFMGDEDVKKDYEGGYGRRDDAMERDVTGERNTLS